MSVVFISCAFSDVKHIGFRRFLLETFVILILLSCVLISGEKWRQTSFPINLTVYCLKVDASGKILAGASDGIYESLDNGESWRKLSIVVGDRSVKSIAVNSVGDYFASGGFYGIIKSTDRGVSWRQITNGIYFRFGLDNPPTDVPTSVLQVFILSDNQMYAGNPGADIRNGSYFYSTDKGESWTQGGLAPMYYSPPAFEFAKDSKKNLYMLSPGRGLYKNGYILQAAPFPSNHVGIDSRDRIYLSSGIAPPLYYSDDYGQTFKGDNAYKAALPVCFLFDSDSPSHVWIGTDRGGVVFSDGGTWQNKNAGIENHTVLALAFTKDKYLLAGTEGKGIYKASTKVTPVELASFEARRQENGIMLTWVTVSESNNYGFEVERKTAEYEADQWKVIAFVKGHSTTNETVSYSYFDDTQINKKLVYRLKQIDFDGAFSYSNEITIEAQVPKNFTLTCYPNPFNSHTVFSYSVPHDSDIQLSIYDCEGRLVRVLQNDFVSSGIYNIIFNAERLSSNVYFCRLKVGEFSLTKKVAYIR